MSVVRFRPWPPNLNPEFVSVFLRLPTVPTQAGLRRLASPALGQCADQGLSKPVAVRVALASLQKII